MALILNLETATTNCSVGLSRDGALIDLREENDGYTHAEKLAVFIQEILERNNIRGEDLDAVSVGKGPGSYTGLRIGVSTAKGLAYALDKPIITVHSLQTMASSVMKKGGAGDMLFCPMIDARRMEVYTALLDHSLQFVQPVSAQIIDENSFREVLDQQPVLFFGDGSIKCKEVIGSHPSAFFEQGIYPSAEGMSMLSEKSFNNEQFEDIAYFEPFYLKDFIATTPRKLI